MSSQVQVYRFRSKSCSNSCSNNPVVKKIPPLPMTRTVSTRPRGQHPRATSHQSLQERGETIASKLSPGDDIQKFKDKLKELEDAFRENQTIAYEKIGKSLKHLENAIDAINKKDIFEIVQAGVMIMANVGALAGTIAGINCSWVLPVCKIFLSIAGIFVSRPSQKTESVQSQIKEAIKEELTDFKLEMLGEEISGVMRGGESMATDLHHFLSNSTQSKLYDGFSETSRSRLDNIYQCMDKLKDKARGKFVALQKESTDLTIRSYKPNDEIPTQRELLTDDTERQRKSHAKHCLMCITAYCDLASIYIMLLSQHKILSHASQLSDDTSLIDKRLDKIYREAKSFLAFLSDKKMLAPIGWWEGKLRVMFEYRITPKYHTPIKRFLSIIELPKTGYSTEEANYALRVCLSLAAYTVPRLDPLFSNRSSGDELFNRSVNHYLCLVNNTQWPVCIFSGLEANKVNNLEFEAEVQPNKSHIHPCIRPRENSFFSSAGIFTVGEGMQLLPNMSNVQYIEFGLSNPLFAPAFAFYKKIYTKPVDSFQRNTLKRSYRADLQTPHDEAKSFIYKGKLCIVKGELKRGKDHGKSFTLYRFFIEEFDHGKLQRQTMAPFVSLMAHKGNAPEGYLRTQFIEARH